MVRDRWGEAPGCVRQRPPKILKVRSRHWGSALGGGGDAPPPPPPSHRPCRKAWTTVATSRGQHNSRESKREERCCEPAAATVAVAVEEESEDCSRISSLLTIQLAGSSYTAETLGGLHECGIAQRRECRSSDSSSVLLLVSFFVVCVCCVVVLVVVAPQKNDNMPGPWNGPQSAENSPSYMPLSKSESVRCLSRLLSSHARRLYTSLRCVVA